MPLKYKSRTRIPRTAAVDWDSIIDELNASGKSSCLCNSESREHAIVYCNDAFCTLTGYLKSEIVQQNATGQFLAGPLTDEATLQEIEHALSHKKAIKVDVLLYQADGTPYWSLVKTETVVKRDRSRDETFMIVTHEDITASKLKRSHSNQFLGKHTLLWDATASDDDRRPSIQAPNGVISRPNAELIEAIIDKEHHHTTKDKLAQIISLNPDLLPEYRETKLPQSHFIILHYGLFRELWNWFIILLCIYTAIAVPYNIAFGNTGLITFNLVVDFMFIIDVILNFRTTYVSSAGRLVVDPKHISRRYLRGWFAVDCISALPLELAYFFISSSSSSLVMLVHVPKLLRLSYMHRLTHKLESVTRYAFGLSILILLLLVFLLFSHWLACFWVTLGRSQGYLGWLYDLANRTEEPFFVVNGTEMSGGPSNSSIYVTALYFSIQSMTTVGFGNFAANTTDEKIFAIFSMIFGALMYATIFGNMTATFELLYAHRLRYRSRFNDIHDFVRLHTIKDPLRQRLIDHLDAVWLHTRGITTEEVLKDFPMELQADICMHLNRGLLSTNRAFSRASPGCLRMLSLSLKLMHSAPGEDIVHKGDKLSKMYFISSGTVEILMKKEVVSLLGKGDVFGQDFSADRTAGKACVDVRAISYCDIHYITREDFVEVLNCYPEFSTTFSASLILSFDVRCEAPVPLTPDAAQGRFFRSRSPRSIPRRLSKRLESLDEVTSEEEELKVRVASTDGVDSGEQNNDIDVFRDSPNADQAEDTIVTYRDDSEKISLSKFSRTSVCGSSSKEEDGFEEVNTRINSMDGRLEAIEHNLEHVLALISRGSSADKSQFHTSRRSAETSL
eukprot:m.225568 g.225568  ORF g.225568 m.225568 type:complete len:845 (+) comp40016_c0_seq15:300-2834(+)